jgi:3-oxoacyl-[acyl-carrier-protein] synthase-3
MDAGIISYGLYLPAESDTAADLAPGTGLSVQQLHDLGLIRKYRPSREDQPVAMAAKAAAQALERAPDLEPLDMDVVIFTGEEYKDYIAQTASIRLQEEIGCLKAYAFDLVGQGVSMAIGLRLARDLMLGDDSVRTVLLAGGTRNVDLVDCRRPDTRFLLPYSASGAALILKKNHGRNLLLDVAVQVDSEMADAVCVPGGGTLIPFNEDNLDSEIMFFQARQPEALEAYLDQTWAGRLADITRAALSGRQPDFLALRHLAPRDRTKVLNDLGLKSQQSPALDDFGHHGANDIIIALDLGLRNQAVRPGFLVALTSGGIGFTYAAAALRWG